MNPFELTSPLEAERLLLRAFTPEDFDAVFAMQSRPDVARYLSWEPRTEPEARRSLGMKVESRAIRSDGPRRGATDATGGLQAGFGRTVRPPGRHLRRGAGQSS